MKDEMCKMDDKKLCCGCMYRMGLTFGIVLGILLLVLALLAMFFHIGLPIVELLSSLFIGYKADLMGALIGLLWGLLYGFIIGALKVFVHKKLR